MRKTYKIIVLLLSIATCSAKAKPELTNSVKSSIGIKILI